MRGQGLHELRIHDAHARKEPRVNKSKLAPFRAIGYHRYRRCLGARAGGRGHNHDRQRGRCDPFVREQAIVPGRPWMRRANGNGLCRIHARSPANAQDDVDAMLFCHLCAGIHRFGCRVWHHTVKVKILYFGLVKRRMHLIEYIRRGN